MGKPGVLDSKANGSLKGKAVVKSKSGTTAVTLERISELEKTLLSSGGGDLNPLVDLLELLRSSKSSIKIKTATAHALYNAFSSLIRQGRLIGKVKEQGPSSEALATVKEWAKARWSEFTDILCAALQAEDPSFAVTALHLLLNLLRVTSEHLSALQSPPVYTFDASFWRKILAALLLPASAPAQPSIRAEFSVKYLNYCDDIRFYFLRGIPELAKANPNSEDMRVNVLFYLECLNTMASNEEDLNQFWAGRPKEKIVKAAKRKITKKRKRAEMEKGNDGSTGIFDDSDEESSEDEKVAAALAAQQRKPGQHDLLSIQMHKKVFTQAWTAFLTYNLSEDEVKRVLVVLHRQVMPYLLDSSILIDFLADCCDYGGTIALLALNGLFALITKHGLDYPHFFRNLYHLLSPQVMHVRYRPRFLRMLNTFLSSTHLPIALVASFIKRLARLCLTAPPAAIVAVIPFIYNLLKAHPTCMVLIHSSEMVEPGETYQDPYRAQEVDPLRTQAIDSSLWEIATLRNHYLASVSTLAKIFNEAFTKPNYDLEDFMDHAYATLFETEITRKMKRAPAMNAAPAESEMKYIFPASGAGIEEGMDEEEAALAMEGKGDIVSQLWRFS